VARRSWATSAASRRNSRATVAATSTTPPTRSAIDTATRPTQRTCVPTRRIAAGRPPQYAGQLTPARASIAYMSRDEAQASSQRERGQS
jgi:hypothetical protein